MTKKKWQYGTRWATEEEIGFIKKLQPKTLLLYRRALCLRMKWDRLDKDRITRIVINLLKRNLLISEEI